MYRWIVNDKPTILDISIYGNLKMICDDLPIDLFKNMWFPIQSSYVGSSHHFAISFFVFLMGVVHVAKIAKQKSVAII